MFPPKAPWKRRLGRRIAVKNEPLSRRRFVVQGAAVVGSAALSAACGPATPTPEHPTAPGPVADGDALSVFQLVTNPCPGKGCSCKACIAHATNNLFPSR